MSLPVQGTIDPDNPWVYLKGYSIRTGTSTVWSAGSGTAVGVCKLFAAHVHSVSALEVLADYINDRLATVRAQPDKRTQAPSDEGIV